jgi:O-antigen ligase
MSGNPLWGLGYGNFWLGDRLEALWALYEWHPAEAHNGYLETYLNLGFFGVALLAALIVSAIKKAANSALKPQLRFLKLSYLLPILLYNLTESAFRGLHIIWFMFLLLAIETQGQMHDQSPENSASVTPSGTSSGRAGRRVS